MKRMIVEAGPIADMLSKALDAGLKNLFSDFKPGKEFTTEYKGKRMKGTAYIMSVFTKDTEKLPKGVQKGDGYEGQIQIKILTADDMNGKVIALVIPNPKQFDTNVVKNLETDQISLGSVKSVLANYLDENELYGDVNDLRQQSDEDDLPEEDADEFTASTRINASTKFTVYPKHR